MTREEYLLALKAAFSEIEDLIVWDFNFPLTEETKKEINDEVTLAVYEHTKDGRRA